MRGFLTLWYLFLWFLSPMLFVIWAAVSAEVSGWTLITEPVGLCRRVLLLLTLVSQWCWSIFISWTLTLVTDLCWSGDYMLWILHTVIAFITCKPSKNVIITKIWTEGGNRTLYHLKFASHTPCPYLETVSDQPIRPLSYLSPMRSDNPRDFGAI